MGQSNSSLETLRGPHSLVSRRVHRLRRLSALSRADLLELVGRLNALAAATLDDNGHQVSFELVADEQAFWRARGHVRCIKSSVDECSSRNIGLADFVAVADHLLAVAEGLDVAQLHKALLSHEDAERDEDECCICLEQRQQLLLNCGHAYCVSCIDRWHVDHATCPVCRCRSDKTDGWVVSEQPDMRDIATDIQKALMSLAEEELH